MHRAAGVHGGHQLGGIRHGRERLERRALGRRLVGQHARLRAGLRIAERQPQREAVELGLGQRERARPARSGSASRSRRTARPAAARLPSTVTWRSCMHSSSADCVRGDARLSSSASTTFANTGPGRNANSLVRWSNTLTPVTSLGSTSGVNWMRANEQSSERASARASVVLPTPGTSSTSTWPSASSATTARSTTARLAADGAPHVRDHAQRRVARELESLRFGECGLHRTHRTTGQPICPALVQDRSCCTRSSTAPAITRFGARGTCVRAVGARRARPRCRRRRSRCRCARRR